MIRELLMVNRIARDGVTEAEPLIVELTEAGEMTLVLDDGERLRFDADELLAIAAGDHVPGSEDVAA